MREEEKERRKERQRERDRYTPPGFYGAEVSKLAVASTVEIVYCTSMTSPLASVIYNGKKISPTIRLFSSLCVPSSRDS